MSRYKESKKRSHSRGHRWGHPREVQNNLDGYGNVMKWNFALHLIYIRTISPGKAYVWCEVCSVGFGTKTSAAYEHCRHSDVHTQINKHLGNPKRLALEQKWSAVISQISTKVVRERMRPEYSSSSDILSTLIIQFCGPFKIRRPKPPPIRPPPPIQPPPPIRRPRPPLIDRYHDQFAKKLLADIPDPLRKIECMFCDKQCKIRGSYIFYSDSAFVFHPYGNRYRVTSHHRFERGMLICRGCFFRPLAHFGFRAVSSLQCCKCLDWKSYRGCETFPMLGVHEQFLSGVLGRWQWKFKFKRSKSASSLGLTVGTSICKQCVKSRHVVGDIDRWGPAFRNGRYDWDTRKWFGARSGFSSCGEEELVGLYL